MKNKWIQRLHDFVSGFWQKLTNIVYDINKINQEITKENRKT